MYANEPLLVKLETGFKCGGCNICFESIILLHNHLSDHLEGGSYKYNHIIHTAYPVSVSVDAYTQTCSIDKENVLTNHDRVQTCTSDENDKAASDVIGTDKRSNFVDAKNLSHDFDSIIKEAIKKDVGVPENVDSSSETESNFEEHIKQDVNISMDTDLSETEAGNYEIESTGNGNGEMRSADVPLPKATDSCKTNVSLPFSMWKNPARNRFAEKYKQHVSLKRDETLKTVTKSAKVINENTRELANLRVSLCNVDCRGGKSTKLVAGLMVETGLKRHSDMKMNSIGDRILTRGFLSNKTFGSGKSKHVLQRNKTREQKVKNHSLTKTGRISTGKLRVQCELCNKLYTNIARHKVLVHYMPGPPRGRPPMAPCPVYKCETCAEIVSRKDREKHNQRHHKLTGPLICEICGEVYPNSTSLNCHKRKHTDHLIRCNKCNFIAKSTEALRLHKKKHKPSDKHLEHVCQVCGKALSYKYQLAIHVRSVHMGEKRFTCNICGKEFARKFGMESHRRIHSDVTMPCSYCGRGFKDVSSLKRHTRTHTGEKNYSCHICNHSFIQSTPYWNHMAKKHSLSKSEALALRQEMIAAENEKQEKEVVKCKEAAGK